MHTYIRPCMHACMHTCLHTDRQIHTDRHTYIHVFIYVVHIIYLIEHGIDITTSLAAGGAAAVAGADFKAANVPQQIL